MRAFDGQPIVMTGSAGARGRARKGLIVGAVVGGHAILLAAAALRPATTPTPQTEPSTITIALFDALRPRGQATPETPASEPVNSEILPPAETQSVEAAAPLVPPTPLLDLATLSEAMAAPDPTEEPRPLSHQATGRPLTPLAASQTADSASTCEMAALLQAGLAEDTKVIDALTLVPRKARSVANAIMLWDGAWTDPAALGGSRALTPIQTAIVAIIRAAPADCHDLIVLGPRLISIPDARGATLLALGSGAWRWEDLLIQTGEGNGGEPVDARLSR